MAGEDEIKEEPVIAGRGSDRQNAIVYGGTNYGRPTSIAETPPASYPGGASGLARDVSTRGKEIASELGFGPVVDRAARNVSQQIVSTVQPAAPNGMASMDAGIYRPGTTPVVQRSTPAAPASTGLTETGATGGTGIKGEPLEGGGYRYTLPGTEGTMTVSGVPVPFRPGGGSFTTVAATKAPEVLDRRQLAMESYYGDVRRAQESAAENERAAVMAPLLETRKQVALQAQGFGLPAGQGGMGSKSRQQALDRLIELDTTIAGLQNKQADTVIAGRAQQTADRAAAQKQIHETNAIAVEMKKFGFDVAKHSNEMALKKAELDLQSAKSLDERFKTLRDFGGKMLEAELTSGMKAITELGITDAEKLKKFQELNQAVQNKRLLLELNTLPVGSSMPLPDGRTATRVGMNQIQFSGNTTQPQK